MLQPCASKNDLICFLIHFPVSSSPLHILPSAKPIQMLICLDCQSPPENYGAYPKPRIVALTFSRHVLRSWKDAEIYWKMSWDLIDYRTNFCTNRFARYFVGVWTKCSILVSFRFVSSCHGHVFQYFNMWHYGCQGLNYFVNVYLGLSVF